MARAPTNFQQKFFFVHFFLPIPFILKEYLFNLFLFKFKKQKVRYVINIVALLFIMLLLPFQL